MFPPLCLHSLVYTYTGLGFLLFSPRLYSVVHSCSVSRPSRMMRTWLDYKHPLNNGHNANLPDATWKEHLYGNRLKSQSHRVKAETSRDSHEKKKFGIGRYTHKYTDPGISTNPLYSLAQLSTWHLHEWKLILPTKRRVFARVCRKRGNWEHKEIHTHINTGIVLVS